MKDDDLMKMWEYRYKTLLDSQHYVLIRVDGRAFHTYCERLDKPYDRLLIDAMQGTMGHLANNLQGVRFAYTQSDEISLLITAFQGDEKDGTRELPFGGSLQKLVSHTAAMASVEFNRIRIRQGAAFANSSNLATFDSRAWTFPGNDEGMGLVMKYFRWRQQDCIRNSVHMAARAVFSAKELHGVNSREQRRMLAEAGNPWEDLPDKFKYGSILRKERQTLLSKDGNTYYRSLFILDTNDELDLLLGRSRDLLPDPPHGRGNYNGKV